MHQGCSTRLSTDSMHQFSLILADLQRKRFRQLTDQRGRVLKEWGSVCEEATRSRSGFQLGAARCQRSLPGGLARPENEPAVKRGNTQKIGTHCVCAPPVYIFALQHMVFGMHMLCIFFFWQFTLIQVSSSIFKKHTCIRTWCKSIQNKAFLQEHEFVSFSAARWLERVGVGRDRVDRGKKKPVGSS